MQASFLASNQVCLEMDLSNPDVMVQSAKAMIDNSGKKLNFTPDQYQKLSQYIKTNMGMGMEMLQSLKPMALQGLLVSGSAGCNTPLSYEDSLKQKAEAGNKTMLGLELPKEQIDLLESQPVDSIIKDLMAAIDDTGASDKIYEQMIKAYKEQDLPGLYAIIVNSGEMVDKMDAFLDTRNKKWIDRIAAQVAKSTTFFAVGAGHLWGTNGVINLLRKAGYTVTPIN